MKVPVAKDGVLKLIQKDVLKFNLQVPIDPKPPGKDIGKFILCNRVARIIAPFDGFFVNINLDWFKGSQSQPQIHEKSSFGMYLLLEEQMILRFPIITYAITKKCVAGY